jgi:hypothetical protein
MQPSTELPPDQHIKFDRDYIKSNLPPLLRLAAPLAATYLIQISIQTISLMVVGRIDGALLGSCALGNMMYANSAPFPHPTARPLIPTLTGAISPATPCPSACAAPSTPSSGKPTAQAPTA